MKKIRDGGFPLDMLLLLPALLYCVHCAESPGPQPDDFSGTLDEAPQIEALSNYVGPAGSATTLIGSNFGSSAAENSVFFAGVEAEVTGVTKGSGGEPDRIETIVPATLPLGPARVTVVVGDRTSNAVTFQVTAAEMIVGVDRPTDLLAANLDGVHGDDLVVACKPINEPHYVAVVLNQGRGEFLPPQRYQIYDGYDLVSVALADFNLDDYPDLVAATYRTTDRRASILLWPGLADGAFGEPTELIGWNTHEISIVVGDFNRDGNEDVLFEYWHYTKAGLLLGRGDGTFLEPIEAQTDPPTHWFPYFSSTSMFHIDGDLIPDLIVHSGVLFGRGDETFSLLSIASLKGPTTVALAGADLDGDGQGDPCFLQRDPVGDISTLRIFSGYRQDSFHQEEVYDLADYATGVIFRDFNGDGSTDIAISTCQSLSTIFRGSAGVSVFLNRGDGTFFPAKSYPIGGMFQASAVVAGDFVLDGNSDLAVCTSSGNGIWFLPGIGEGKFHTAASYTTQWLPFSLSSSDLDGDGILDLLGTHEGPESLYGPIGLRGGVSVLFGEQGQAFRPVQSWVVGINPVDACAGSLNGDDFADIVFADMGTEPDFEDGGLYVLFADAPGVFSEEPAKLLDPSATSVSLGDFNADSHLDIVASAVHGNQVLVLLGNGDGSFLPPQKYGTGTNPVQVEVTDLDGDGAQDLVVGSEYEPSVTVHLGRGNGSFSDPVSYSVWGTHLTTDVEDEGGGGSVFNPLSIGDVDGDFTLDIVVVSPRQCTAGVLLGNGDGTFRRSAPLAEDVCGKSVVISDLDRDGVMDLAVGGNGRGGISLLLGKGGGKFAPPAYYAAGGDAWDIISADLDQDGDLDLAVPNMWAKRITVIWLEPGGGQPSKQ